MRRVSWMRRFQQWAFPSQNEAPEVSAARSKLSLSQREIAEELEGTFASYQERLQDLATRLSVLDDQGIQAEGESIRDAQQALRRAIRRVTVSERTTQELMNEWQDWERYPFQGPSVKAIVDERREMLRSELSLRGVRLGNEERATVVEPEEIAISEIPLLSKEGLGEVGASVCQTAVPQIDHFREWDELIAPAIQNEVAQWENALSDQPLEFGEPSHLVSLLHRRKDAHARLVSLERLR